MEVFETFMEGKRLVTLDWRLVRFRFGLDVDTGGQFFRAGLE